MNSSFNRTELNYTDGYNDCTNEFKLYWWYYTLSALRSGVLSSFSLYLLWSREIHLDMSLKLFLLKHSSILSTSVAQSLSEYISQHSWLDSLLILDNPAQIDTSGSSTLLFLSLNVCYMPCIFMLVHALINKTLSP